MAIRGYKVPANHQRDPVKTAWLAGPLMEFQFEFNGEVQMRQGHLAEFFQDGIYWIQAADDPQIMPRHFILNNHFPWHHFQPMLLNAWSRDPYLPFCLKPDRRIPEEIIENLKLIEANQFPRTLDALRQQGFLPRLRKLSQHLRRFPADLNWEEVRAHCFKALPITLNTTTITSDNTTESPEETS